MLTKTDNTYKIFRNSEVITGDIDGPTSGRPTNG
jgi:hypothetical protein